MKRSGEAIETRSSKKQKIKHFLTESPCPFSGRRNSFKNFQFNNDIAFYEKDDEDVKPEDNLCYPKKTVDRGFGLFASKLIKKGQLITYYGGDFLDRNECNILRDQNKHTHLKSINLHGFALDGRLNTRFNIYYYIHNNRLASLANDAYGSSKKNNSVFINVERGFKYGDFHYQQGIAIIALDDINPDEEILVDYGKDYHNHFF